ncbi:type 1 glutamine amidotransferase [Scardovia wiggsiae]|uniref:type 1 glutamine amidotransferase n=1 Tax=Scardovia wiggsiae TaxID=230143 RepID=UPI00374ED7C3
MSTGRKQLDIVSLYPKDMNIYGDFGNLKVIEQRTRLYGYEPRIHMYNVGDAWPARADLIVGGGGQDHGQVSVSKDLFTVSDTLHTLADNGVPILVICGLYQLFGHYFETVDGARLSGIGILGVHTVGQKVRMIGNITEHTSRFGDVIGYENHSGQTFLDDPSHAWGTVDGGGMGNNGEDHTEGAVYRNVIGTYLHGALLPKNPAVADYLIGTAAANRYGSFEDLGGSDEKAQLEKLNSLADAARKTAMARPR